MCVYVCGCVCYTSITGVNLRIGWCVCVCVRERERECARVSCGDITAIGLLRDEGTIFEKKIIRKKIIRKKISPELVC